MIENLIALTAAVDVQEALETFLFGSTWYLGILVFIILCLLVVKLWRYAAVFLLPIIMALEVAYFNKNDIYGSTVWPMVILLFLAVGISLYAVFGGDKK